MSNLSLDAIRLMRCHVFSFLSRLVSGLGFLIILNCIKKSLFYDFARDFLIINLWD